MKKKEILRPSLAFYDTRGMIQPSSYKLALTSVHAAQDVCYPDARAELPRKWTQLEKQQLPGISVHINFLIDLVWQLAALHNYLFLGHNDVIM